METKSTHKSSNHTAHPTNISHKSACYAIFTVLLPVIWTGISVIVSQYVIIFPLYWLLGRDTLTTPLWTTIYTALIYLLTLFLVLFVGPKIFKSWKSNREALGLKNLPTWTDIGLAPIGFIISLILGGILINAFSIFPFFDVNQAQDVGFNLLNTGFDRIIAFLALVIIAPIAEEIVFRGWLYGKLRDKIPGDKLSLILSILIVSILFGLLHGQWNVGVTVFARSVICCLLREVTGTIYSGIILHIIKNAVAFVLLYVIGIV